MGKYLGCNLLFKKGKLKDALEAMGTIPACIQRSIDAGIPVNMEKEVTLCCWEMQDFGKQCVEH
jgi:hypothetical protein